VVEAGLTVVLVPVTRPTPWSIVIEVAPVTIQARADAPPAMTLDGVAVKDVMAGALFAAPPPAESPVLPPQARPVVLARMTATSRIARRLLDWVMEWALVQGTGTCRRDGWWQCYSSGSTLSDTEGSQPHGAKATTTPRLRSPPVGRPTRARRRRSPPPRPRPPASTNGTGAGNDREKPWIARRSVRESHPSLE
jgi:hypothetical protein